MKYQRIYRILIVLWLGLILGACNRASKDHQVFFAIFPHFAIQSAKLDAQRKSLSKTIPDPTNITILIISPDHFKQTTSNNQAFVESTGSVCFQWDCIRRLGLFTSNKNELFPKTIITKEHGRWAHFRFINRYFSGAQIVLLKTIPRNFLQANNLLGNIRQLSKTTNLLVIASVDFSHYTSESFAKIHDKTSRYTLLDDQSTISDFQKIEVDCPLCLYLTNTRAKDLGYCPVLKMRDSSSSILDQDLGTGNTSRQIIFYTTWSCWSPWITLGFAGDLIFDRGVSTKLSTPTKIAQHFQDRFQSNDLTLLPQTNIHRKWFGIDLLWFNLETPIVASWESCNFQHSKLVNFCSSDIILPILSQLGRNVANIANNHSLDAWSETKKQSELLLNQDKIPPFGEDTIVYRKIRSVKVALHGYNLLETNLANNKKICTAITKDKAQNNVVVLNVHRWQEYSKIHTLSQEWLAKYFIDCGADAIIWHHPHVVQDIQRYKGKPIVYSLGNFLFDQYSPDTQTGMIALLDIPLSGEIVLETHLVNTLP